MCWALFEAWSVRGYTRKQDRQKCLGDGSLTGETDNRHIKKIISSRKSNGMDRKQREVMESGCGTPLRQGSPGGPPQKGDISEETEMVRSSASKTDMGKVFLAK